jgi:hypothetical protein
MLKSIMISYQDGDWATTAEPPVTLNDPLILFFNQDNQRACQISFPDSSAFGILGIALAPRDGFVLVYRGIATTCEITDAPTFLPQAEGAVATAVPIPPGS